MDMQNSCCKFKSLQVNFWTTKTYNQNSEKYFWTKPHTGSSQNWSQME